MSRTVDAGAGADRSDGSDLARLACMGPAGAGVIRGSGRAIVVATGRASTLGQVEALLVEPGRGESLLERQVAELSRLTAVIAVVCGAATLSLAISFRGTGVVAALTFATGVIVALVPEGLLPLLASLGPFEIIAVAGSTLTFLGIVGGQIGCLFAQRDGSLRARLSLHRNPWIALGLAVELALALVLVYVPGVDALFSMAPVSPVWLLALPIGAAIVITADHLRRVLIERLGASSSEPRSS